MELEIKQNKKTKPLSWLLRYAGKEKFKLLVLVILNAIMSAASVIYAFTIKIIVNGAVNHNKEGIILGSIYSLCVIASQFILRIIIGFLSENINARLEVNYKSHIFSSLLNKKYGEITKFHSGEIMNRLSTDVYTISEGLTSIFPSIVSALTRLVFAIVALFSIVFDWVYAVVLVFAGCIIFTTVLFVRKRLKNLHKKAKATEGSTRSFMQESVENVLAIKALSLEERVNKQSKDLQEINYKVKMKRKNYSVLGNSFYYTVFSLGYIFTMIYGCFQIYNGDMDYGSLTAILQLVNNIQVPFMSLSNVFPEYYAMIASTERLIELEEIEDENLNSSIDKEEFYKNMLYISGESINFTYDKKNVICGGSFKIEKGDFAVISGISGIGKSTLIKLVLGVYNLNQGDLYFKTTNGNVNIDSSTRCLFSYVPQGNMIFSGSLLDNLKFACPLATWEEIENALRISCSYDFVKELPADINTVVGEGGFGLSEGQVQRIAIARAILTKSPILLLDEATSALDEKTERQVLKNIKEELKDYTVIIISHKKASFEICNKKISIVDGIINQE